MAFIGIEALGTNAEPCIPAMTEYVKQESEFYITGGYTWTRFHGRAILYKLAPNSDFFRSPNSRYWALYAILASDREIGNRLSALNTLRQMAEKGEEFSGSTYAIESALTDQAIQVRIAATNALKQIDVEAMAKARVK